MSDLETLRKDVEDLALRAVVAHPDAVAGLHPDSIAGWASSLDSIAQAARKQGADHAAAIAAEASAALSRERSEPESLSQLQTAIIDLQRALDEADDASRQTPAALAQDRELMADFILESREHLANIETQVLLLERDSCDREALNAAFRAFHTIKGLAGFLEIAEVQKLAHEVEALLDRARNAELTLTPPAIDIILGSADHLNRWMAHLEAVLERRPSEPPAHDGSLYARISELVNTATAPPAASDPGPEVPASATPQPATKEPAAEVPVSKANKHRAGTNAIKVDTGKLDYLVDMAGEMVIAESLVRHDPELSGAKNPRLQRNLAQLTRITAELQKTAMAMRLVPIGPLFQRMARLVRDLARQFGKSVDMVTEGDEIELDRTIVEELADPLMHMVRNAMDHGVERPEDRRRKGKNERAVVTLRAQHRAGQVVVEIADDGRGLDRSKIAATAIERGLITSADGLTDNEIYNLIFEPGFSTAQQVTNVSGRGVGMDVVRRHIEKLRGRIEIRSVPGAGTTFCLKLPLTLAIIDGLVVTVGSERYIVPMFAVREMFRPKPDTLWTVEERGEMALVRGSLLPVLRLYRRFAVAPRSENPLESVLIVVEVEGRRFGLLVDDLLGKQEVVIKGLGELFRDVSGISGGAILGDGRVGLILDMDRLYRGRMGDVNH
jgi:two-component system chemotaxis sensor kinase CheA